MRACGVCPHKGGGSSNKTSDQPYSCRPYPSISHTGRLSGYNPDLDGDALAMALATEKGESAPESKGWVGFDVIAPTCSV